jgi:hypothetical protein
MSDHDVTLSLGPLSLDVDTAKKYFERCFPGEDIIFSNNNISNNNISNEPKSYISVGVSRVGTVLFANKINKLEIPNKSYLSSDDAESYLRREYPGVQIRFCGLPCGEFPYPKRIPFIDVGLDGTGHVVFATMRDRVSLPVKSLLLDLNTAEKYLKKCYPDTQLRYSGLMFGPFPHQKRTPYIDVGVDGTGTVLFAKKICS